MEKKTENQIEKAKACANAILQKTESDLPLNPKEKDALASVANKTYENWREERIEHYDQKEAWNLLEQKIRHKKVVLSKVGMIKKWQSIAAIILLLILGGEAYLLFNRLNKTEPVVVYPGKSMAYLEVDGTQHFDLHTKDTLLQLRESEVQIDSGIISYHTEKQLTKANEYHKINVPRNGEFFIKLSDGTKVWINSESSLAFFSRFTGKERIVELSGEAYFEVAKNPDQAFIVRTAHADVRVLGTQFNVKAYPDEEYTYTSLNEGKVQVSNELQQEVLQVNEQLVVNNANGHYQKRQVDAKIYSAWVKGKFLFKDERLEDILLTLSRWYDVEVFFANPDLKEERFSVSLNRYDNISNLLEHIEMTGSVEFDITQETLLVK